MIVSAALKRRVVETEPFACRTFGARVLTSYRCPTVSVRAWVGWTLAAPGVWFGPWADAQLTIRPMRNVPRTTTEFRINLPGPPARRKPVSEARPNRDSILRA